MSATFGFGEPHDVACAEVATHTVHTHICIYELYMYINIYIHENNGLPVRPSNGRAFSRT